MSKKLDRRKVYLFEITYYLKDKHQSEYKVSILSHTIDDAKEALFRRIGQFHILQSGELGVVHLATDQVSQQIINNYSVSTESSFTDESKKPVVL